ncbi:tetratricopeptide repeat protein [Nocardia sp. NPDC088792]|uniref:tetratricopeptide repeat protein n=1 Tax=Nocardia sp. NPDC088792 TaxID=3364332 RepID=UPI0037FECA4C
MAEMADQVRREQDATTLIHLYGLEGLGVSCFATEFSKKYSDLVAGRLIWLTGRRPDGRAVPLGELHTRASRQLGISNADQGATDEEKADVYRAATKHKKFMLVLDDLADLGQATGLIPDDAPEAVIVVTSGFERPGLTARGFAPFTPTILTPEQARTLFHLSLGDTAPRIPPSTIDALVELCGGLPLMIKVLAAQIRGRASHADHLLSQLLKRRVSLLALDEEKRMTKFLNRTYRGLTRKLARAYRRLGSLPAADFSLDSAAAALGCDPDEAFIILTKLTEYHLLTITLTGRYAFHTVLRDDARIRARADDDDVALEGVAQRWIDWNLRETLPRAAAVSNRWWVPPVHALAAHYWAAGIPALPRTEALAWFESEAPNLIAAIQFAHNRSHHTQSWVLCVLLWKYLHIHGYFDAWIDTHRVGLASARAAESDFGVMQLCLQLGAAYLDTGEYADADRLFDEALTIGHEHAHGLGEQSALEWLGKTAARQGKFDVALEYFQRSWEVADRDQSISPADRGRVFAILELQQTRTLADTDRWDGVAQRARKVLAYFDDLGNETDNCAKIRMVLGRALLAQGEAADAATIFGDAADFFAAEGARRHQADAEHLRSRALLAARRIDDAEIALHTAFDLYRGVGSPLANAVAHDLAQLENDRHSSELGATGEA